MIGIRFKIPNNFNNYLHEILKNIKSEGYLWSIEEDEVLTKESSEFFNQNLYNDSMFKEIIKNKSYIIFVNIQLIKDDSKKEYQINNYDDFLKSNCELILFITDSEFVDIYSKNENYIKTINQNAIVNDFQEIKILYKNDIIRDEFSAFTD